MCCVHELQVKLETPTPFITSKLNPQLIFRDSPIMMYKTTGRPKGMFSVHYKSYCSLKCLRLMLVNYVCHFCYEVRDINKRSSSNLLSSIVPCKRECSPLSNQILPYNAASHCSLLLLTRYCYVQGFEPSILYIFYYFLLCIQTYIYLLKILSLFHGNARSAFIASTCSVGITTGS